LRDVIIEYLVIQIDETILELSTDGRYTLINLQMLTSVRSTRAWITYFVIQFIIVFINVILMSIPYKLEKYAPVL